MSSPEPPQADDEADHGEEQEPDGDGARMLSRGWSGGGRPAWTILRWRPPAATIGPGPPQDRWAPDAQRRLPRDIPGTRLAGLTRLWGIGVWPESPAWRVQSHAGGLSWDGRHRDGLSRSRRHLQSRGRLAAQPASPQDGGAQHGVDRDRVRGGRDGQEDKQQHRLASGEAAADPPPKLKRKEYEREMRRLHGELVAMQEWVKASGAKICIVFEGRDTAGKGGTIKRITERVSPRVFRVVALAAPTEREKSQMYIQRYIPHLPAAGEVVIFDRSWYNRAGVERVMGFCTPEETERFLELAPAVEKAMVDSGILLLKYWLEVSPDEQTRRLERRIDDPRKVWKLSDMDLKSYSRWYDYSRARDAMFAATDTAWAPWYIARHRRQAARPAQPHQPPAEPGPLQAARPQRHHPAQAAAGRRLCGARPPVAVHPHAVLNPNAAPRVRADRRRIGATRWSRTRRDAEAATTAVSRSQVARPWDSEPALTTVPTDL